MQSNFVPTKAIYGSGSEDLILIRLRPMIRPIYIGPCSAYIIYTQTINIYRFEEKRIKHL